MRFSSSFVRRSFSSFKRLFIFFNSELDCFKFFTSSLESELISICSVIAFNIVFDTGSVFLVDFLFLFSSFSSSVSISTSVLYDFLVLGDDFFFGLVFGTTWV